ncbi:MAG: hypothetical protein WAZ34_01075 [Rhodocyclaceae bacterium]
MKFQSEMTQVSVNRGKSCADLGLLPERGRSGDQALPLLMTAEKTVSMSRAFPEERRRNLRPKEKTSPIEF